MFSLTFTVTGATLEEINQNVHDLATQLMPPPTATPTKEISPKKDAAPKAADVKKEEKSAPAPKAAEPKKDAAKAASGLTLESIGAKIAELCADKSRGGKDKARELLTKYGAKKGSELKPEQYAAFIADVDATLNPSTGESEEDGLM